MLDFDFPETYVAATMATIRDVVEALGRTSGVDAVVVVGRDGLPIDSRVANGVDAESVAALQNTNTSDNRSPIAIVAVLHADAILIVLVQPATNVGALLFDLRRHRTAIAGLL